LQSALPWINDLAEVETNLSLRVGIGEHLAPANLFALLPKELMNEGKQQLHGKSFQAPYHKCDMYHLSGYF